MTNLLSKIKEDMDVYDLEGSKIGTVEHVQMGSEGTTPDTETEVKPDQPRGVAAPRAKAEGAAVILPSDDQLAHLPQGARERLAMHGFIKVDSGFLRSDRFVMTEQIESVDTDGVKVNVKREDLLKA